MKVGDNALFEKNPSHRRSDYPENEEHNEQVKAHVAVGRNGIFKPVSKNIAPRVACIVVPILCQRKRESMKAKPF